MSDGASIKTGPGGGLKRLKDMIARGKDASAALARVYPLYQKLQTERFESENSSEGAAWPALNKEYADYKKRRYGGGPRRASKKREAGNWNSYPGEGTKMMIGTGMLAGAVIGPSSGSPFTDGTSNHRAMFTSTQMVISVEESGTNPDGNPFDYAHLASERRPFMIFGQDSIHQMMAAVQKFMVRGE